MVDKLDALDPALKDISRITIVDDEGRAYEQSGLYDIEYSVQDEGRTLKLFVKAAPKVKN